MLAGMRLLRRIGLAVGAWFFALYAGLFVGELSYRQGYTTTHIWAMAAGATIFAFFLPSVPASSFGEKQEKE
jgi:hypothetical protein